MKKITKLIGLLSVMLLGFAQYAAACTAPVAITGINRPICPGENTDTFTNATGGGTWSSSNTLVAVIGSNGVVAGISAGTCSIIYTTGTGCFSSITVTVNPVPDSIVGQAYICYGFFDTLTDLTAGGIWTAVTTTVAGIGSLNGVVASVAHAGRTEIYYTLSTGCYQTAYVTVHTEPLSLSGNLAICQGYLDTLESLAPSGGSWISANPAVGSVVAFADPTNPLGGSGQVTGVSAGTAVISYYIAACPAATDTITVNPLPAAIAGLTTICIGLPISLADSSMGGTWGSSDSTVALIDSISGTVTVMTSTIGLTTTITYTLPTGCFITTLVTTNSAPDTIIGLDSVCQGASLPLYDSTTGGTWSSTALATAQVIDTSGMVYGIDSGLATISYTLPSGCYATLPFYVKPPIPAWVGITDTPAGTLCYGTPIRFVASDSNCGVPTFQWMLFDSVIHGATNDTLNSYLPHHGDVIIIRVVTHGICSVRDTVYDTVAANVYPNDVRPNIGITTSDTFARVSGDTVFNLWFPGQVISFYSSVTFGGTDQSYQWFNNRLLISGATDSWYTATIYGGNDTFACRVIGNPPCDTGSDTAYSNRIYILGSYLSATTVSLNHGLTLYPNPNSGNFTLSGSLENTNDNDVTVQVYDVMGRQVYNNTVHASSGQFNEQLDMATVPAGTYILKTSTAEASDEVRFVVER